MKQLLKSLLPLFIFFFVANGCKKENDETEIPKTNPITNPTPTGSGTICGTILDESGTGISNATVTVSSQNTVTDADGIFLLRNVGISGRSIATVTKAGFFNSTYAFIAKENAVSYIRVVLISDAPTHSISATAGGTVSLTDGSSIQFMPNSFADATTGASYTGTVSLTVKHLSPDAQNFGFMIPGGDLLGTNAGSSDVALYSYGMVGAVMKGSSGEALQIKTGNTATITMPVAASQNTAAPSSIPLWYFDEGASLWREQGSATRVGNNYVGMVSHFTWWNCDFQGPRATVMGKVLDCDGVPIPNVVVTVNGYLTLTTNSAGVYSSWIPAGMPYTIQVLASNNFSLFTDSQMENIPALSASQTYIVPDLIVLCPAALSGTLQRCASGNSDGMVVLRWTGGMSFAYTTTGAFDLICAANSTINLAAYTIYSSSIYSTSGQYSSPAMGGTTNIGNVVMCNQSSAIPNSFTINGGPFVNQTFVVDTNTVWTQDGGLYFTVQLAGTAPGYTIFHFDVYFANPATGTYSWNTTNTYVQLYFTNGSSTWKIYTDEVASVGMTNVSYFGGIGDRVVATFTGNSKLIINGNTSNQYAVTISGSVDAFRQN
jgi:hypothetical protein